MRCLRKYDGWWSREKGIFVMAELQVETLMQQLQPYLESQLRDVPKKVWAIAIEDALYPIQRIEDFRYLDGYASEDLRGVVEMCRFNKMDHDYTMFDKYEEFSSEEMSEATYRAQELVGCYLGEYFGVDVDVIV